MTWIRKVKFLLWKRLLKSSLSFYIHHHFNSVVPWNEFFSRLRRAYTFNILLMIRTTLPNEAGINLRHLTRSQFPSALLSFFPSIAVLGNGAGYDTCQCEKVRQRESEREKEKWERGCLRIASVMTVRLNFGNFWVSEKLRLSLRIREQSPVQCQCVWHSTQRKEDSRDRQIAIRKMRVPISATPLIWDWKLD